MYWIDRYGCKRSNMAQESVRIKEGCGSLKPLRGLGTLFFFFQFYACYSSATTTPLLLLGSVWHAEHLVIWQLCHFLLACSTFTQSFASRLMENWRGSPQRVLVELLFYKYMQAAGRAIESRNLPMICFSD